MTPRSSSPPPARSSAAPGAPASTTSPRPPTSAASAQQEWAALPHPARAAVLRKAGDLFGQHADELAEWNVREVGAIPRHGRLRPARGGRGVLRPPRACRARRSASCSRVRSRGCRWPSGVPVGVVGVISPVQRAADPQHPLGGAGARARQRRAAQAGPADRGDRRREHRRASSRRPGCRPACSSCCPAAPTSARRSSPTRTCASSPSPARRPPVARSASSPAGTSSAPTSSSAATPRCSCSTTPTSRRRSTSRRGGRSSTRARSA